MSKLFVDKLDKFPLAWKVQNQVIFRAEGHRKCEEEMSNFKTKLNQVRQIFKKILYLHYQEWPGGGGYAPFPLILAVKGAAG